MISKTLKISLVLVVLFSLSFVNAQERKDKKRGNPEELFKKLDTNADGALSLEEFQAKRSRDEARAEIIDKRFKTLDTDADGSLSLEEFVSRKEMTKEELIEERFAHIDTNSNGTIDLLEYKAFLKNADKFRKKHQQRRHKKED